MSRGIYLVREDASLVEMREQEYPSEALLQKLLADFPNILAGDDIGGEQRRWLLISRELGVPDEEGRDRWALDHLFLDQDAIPTIVEVKRASDRRIRREVIGQMLDYAANGVAYWPAGTIRKAYEATCEDNALDAAELLSRLLGGPDEDQDEFWQKAEDNLATGKIRLTFVSDEIPRELRTVVEFLNKQMEAEVLAVEIRQYVSDGLRTLVPRLVGQTAESWRRKGSPKVPADEVSVMRALGEADAGAAAAARSLLQFAEEAGLECHWVSRSWGIGFRAFAVRRNLRLRLFSIYSNCECFVSFARNESSLAEVVPGLAKRSQAAVEAKLGTMVTKRSEAQGWCKVRLDVRSQEVADIIRAAAQEFLAELSAAAASPSQGGPAHGLG